MAGRTLVVHLSDGTRVLCGIINPSWSEVASIGGYVGSSGSVGGMMLVHPTSYGIYMSGLLSGLESSVTGGYHVHTGVGGCSSGEAVDGAGPPHYYDTPTDPWTVVQYSSDSQGVAIVSQAMSDFSLYASLSVYGHAIVVHQNGGARSGCGVIGSTSSKYPGVVPSLSVYPEYTGGLRVRGMLSMMSSGSGSLRIRGVLAGLEVSTSGGWHIHSGFGCSAATGAGSPGPHFFDGLSSDPWNVVRYHTDASGVALIDETVAGFGGGPGSIRGVAGRTVVIHSSSGTRIACGIIAPYAHGQADVVHIGPYPDYGVVDNGALEVFGMMYERPTARMGVLFSGLFTGVVPNYNGGWHVHSGVSCATRAAVGPHYFAPLPTDPWNPVRYDSFGGSALIDQFMPDFSWAADLSIAGRAIVAHDQSNLRAGCGVGHEITPRTLPPPPPPLPPTSPPSPFPPPPSPMPPASPGVIITWSFVVVANYSAPGTVASFNGVGLANQLVAHLGIPSGNLEVSLRSGSVLIDVAATYDERPSADAGKIRLDNFNMSEAVGMPVTTLDPPRVVRAPIMTDADALGSGGQGLPLWVIILIIAISVLLILCCYCWCTSSGPFSTRRRCCGLLPKKKKRDSPAGPPMTGKERKYSSAVELEKLDLTTKPRRRRRCRQSRWRTTAACRKT